MLTQLSYRILATAIRCTKRQVGIALIGSILWITLGSCSISEVQPETTSAPDVIHQEQTPASAPATPSKTSQPGPQTSTPLPAPTRLASSTATPTALPELLIATSEVIQKGEPDEYHNVWLINTLSGEKELVFTTTPGTRLTQLIWDEEQPDILYVAEVKGIGEGNVTWQLYQVNHQTGESRAYFDEPQAGAPTLLDMSAQGKWLRIFVDHVEPVGFTWWFVNTEDGSVIKHDPFQFFWAGFAWSPTDPDIFAYAREATLEEVGRSAPQSVVISDVTSFEVLEAIDYQHTNWEAGSVMVWDSSEPDEILYFTTGDMYIVDLVDKQWTRVAKGLDVHSADGKMVKSPSGQWAATTLFAKVVPLNGSANLIEQLDEVLGQGVEFLSWYDDKDWMIVVTHEDAKVRVYELEDGFELTREIDLTEYGIDSSELNMVLARSLERPD